MWLSMVDMLGSSNSPWTSKTTDDPFMGNLKPFDCKLFVQYDRRACEPRICIMWTFIIIFARYLGKSSCSGFVTPRGAGFFRLNSSRKALQLSQHGWPLGSLWIRHLRRVSRGISGTSSSASMLITKGIPRSTPQVLWIAPRRMAG